MTVPVNDRLIQHTAVGAETSFDYDFRILDADDLVVQRTPSGGSAITLTSGSDYTVNGVGNAGGGSITLDGTAFPSGATADDVWTLYSATELERSSDFQTDGDLLASTVNDQFDDIIHMLQEQDTTAGRSVARPRSSTETYSLDWPDGADTTPRALVASTDGGLEIGPSTTDIANAQSNAADAATAKTAAEAAQTAAETAQGLAETAQAAAEAATSSKADDDLSNVDPATGRTALGLGTAAVEDASAFEAANADILKADESDNLEVGFTSTAHDYGGGSAVTSGTVTVDFTESAQAYYTNGGAHTLAPDSGVEGGQDILITNNASAGAVTTSGFDDVIGDSFDTTDGNRFLALVRRINSRDILTIVALQ